MLLRVISLFLLAIGAVILPYSAVFGGLIFFIVVRNWFFAEAVFLGFIFDAISGLPFGSYVLFFAALVVLVEFSKLYLRRGLRFGAIPAAVIAVVIFGVLEILFFSALGGQDAFLSPGFYWNIMIEWFLTVLTLAVLLAIYLMINNVWKKKTFDQ